MYEKFTDRSRKVMQLANQEAQRMNHEYIGAGHLLIAILKEGSGVAAQVFQEFKIELGAVRREVERIEPSGPEMVTMGKLPQTPRVKSAIERAIKVARDEKSGYVGTQHIAEALVSDADNIAAKVLAALGIDAVKLQERFLAVIKEGSLRDDDVPSKVWQIFSVNAGEPSPKPCDYVRLCMAKDIVLSATISSVTPELRAAAEAVLLKYLKE